MLSNLNLTKGVVFSQEMMLELTKVGFTREKAYKIIQKHAKDSFSKNKNLIDLIKEDKIITNSVSNSKINSIFKFSKHLKNINFIFKRVFK